MKILIAADMEGVSGVTTWDQVTAGKPDYERFRSLMTEDVNAAVRGAFDAKVEEVFVTDGHASGSNILIEDLDSRASLNTGSPSPLSMVQGVDEVDGVIYVGYPRRVARRHPRPHLVVQNGRQRLAERHPGGGIRPQRGVSWPLWCARVDGHRRPDGLHTNSRIAR